MKTKPNDLKKRTVLLRKRLSPELEKIIIALELAEAADDPAWAELAVLVLNDMKYLDSAEGQKLKKRNSILMLLSIIGVQQNSIQKMEKCIKL